ncbi:MAG: hypothetical protein LBQ87_01020, partial [Candidatus Fibromonas sp.]|nr:hypothetical protein [Candidatus Fibromonas sp.]
MKKAILVLSVIALIICACKEKPDKPTVVNGVDSLKNDSVTLESHDNTLADDESEKEHFVVKSDWEGVECKKYNLDYGDPIQECTFPNANLQQVYNIVKRTSPNLKTELSPTNLEYPSTEEGCISVKYQYKSEKHLLIEISYEGGMDYIEITENKGYAQSKIHYSP